jgi:hypothetical protein
MEVITEATNACAVREEDNHALLERAREKFMEEEKESKV